MKKLSIIIILLSIFMMSANSQAKKNIKSSKANTEKIQLDEIKANAEKWFKDVYVESFFKDPYSYKLLKSMVTSISKKESLIKDISMVQNRIDTCSLAMEDRNTEAYDICIKELERGKAEYEKEMTLLKSATSAFERETHEGRAKIHQKYNTFYLTTAKMIQLYLLDIKEREVLTLLLSNLDSVESEKLAYYEIRIDCYSKNSIGNEVLGRFSFPFTINGPMGDNNGIDKVSLLN